MDDLRMSGCLKALFPRSRGRLDAMLLNTAGGLTGGDRIRIAARAGAGAALSLSTQAAERAYRAAGGTARVETRLAAAPGASLLWLPQETILYDGARLDRRLSVALEGDARLLMVEPVIFGRAAMGEVPRDVTIRDRIAVTRDGAPLWRDGWDVAGDLRALMDRAATGRGAGAMASLFYAAPDAEAHLAAIRALLPATAGATRPAPDTLALRLLAPDGWTLRRALLPVLDRLTGGTLPICWRL
ncbi:urease accessory protein UreD [Jannaschia ovalis]|uniref:Urease accessory protein UreD n=1 Tax=Jannaschia ovalis TaxID=3038773 RepID=A0ABY8LH37_9RHOB|nr:urease accessory protein UreD [Jannaschia sp. GRR-S6-38]WGH79967.1 urease accessory protein UreD [Jannaschia sp. GRR-S6-38]